MECRVACWKDRMKQDLFQKLNDCFFVTLPSNSILLTFSLFFAFFSYPLTLLKGKTQLLSSEDNNIIPTNNLPSTCSNKESPLGELFFLNTSYFLLSLLCYKHTSPQGPELCRQPREETFRF